MLKEPTCQSRRHKRLGFDPWVRKISWRRKWQPTPVFLPGKFHRQRSLVGYSPWGCKESDKTKSAWAHMHTHTHTHTHTPHTHTHKYSDICIAPEIFFTDFATNPLSIICITSFFTKFISCVLNFLYVTLLKTNFLNFNLASLDGLYMKQYISPV